MMQVIRSLLLSLVDKIDSGNSNITPEEELKIIDLLHKYTDKDRKLSKYQACQYFNMSRATFDNYVREGKLPKGRKEQGFKELFWMESELRKCLYKNK